MPHCNDAGLALIETFEGERLRAYPDPGTGGDPWTIAFGHTAHVHPGDTCTHAQAIAFLRTDVANAEAAVVRGVEVQLTPNQFSALVSFEYNTGALRFQDLNGNWIDSTLLGCVNARDWVGAAAQFLRWVYAGGNALPGLVRRRQAESALFFRP
jgi:lysozyme